jgi:hypothetical protein
MVRKRGARDDVNFVVQEKWIEEWRIRCHRCTYRGTLTEVSVEEHMEEETIRH